MISFSSRVIVQSSISKFQLPFSWTMLFWCLQSVLEVTMNQTQFSVEKFLLRFSSHSEGFNSCPASDNWRFWCLQSVQDMWQSLRIWVAVSSCAEQTRHSNCSIMCWLQRLLRVGRTSCATLQIKCFSLLGTDAPHIFLQSCPVEGVCSLS